MRRTTVLLQCAAITKEGHRCRSERAFLITAQPEVWYCWRHRDPG